LKISSISFIIFEFINSRKITSLLPYNLFPTGSGTGQTRADALALTTPLTLPALAGMSG
jgi:hypothetical protein